MENKENFSFSDMMERQFHQKVNNFKKLNGLAHKNEIVMAGSSLMEQFPIYELLMDRGIHKIVYNRGIGGMVAQQMLAEISALILDLAPRKLFINIGTNDLGSCEGYLSGLLANYAKILDLVRERVPGCEIIMMAYYPVSHLEQTFRKNASIRVRTNAMVNEANAALEKLAAEKGCRFINVNHVLVDSEGYVRDEFAVDHIHMLPTAYDLILNEILQYM